MKVNLDSDGHLADPADWSPEVAADLAAAEGLVLNDDHWWVISFVRSYHQRYGNPPLMKTLVSGLREKAGPESGSRDLYRLFPEGPVRLACKYGGLPKPDWCI
ncbi:MAG TPA: TusE/DsrC/DsvC family sulfur relay protein [Wenzhouxiangella sp.]|nr:TusE/DsrC/DsvC family sulfur relay protein [Wenzhouxiangella sp.]